MVRSIACWVGLATLSAALIGGWGCRKPSGSAAPTGDGSPIHVEWFVSVPSDTPPDAVVHISGNLPQLGGVWRPDGVPLTRRQDGLWHARLALPRGLTLQYKFTLGSWERVERDDEGRDIPNRSLRLDGDRRVRVSVERWADGKPRPRRSTLTGDIRFHADFPSAILGNRRSIAVFLPPDYERQPEQRYPVLYMHDGQNVFDEATSFAGEWQADETAGRLIEQGKIPPIIIVAVANAGEGRIDEYTPSVDARYVLRVGGRAAEYARFLLEEVKPFIDRTYRTLPDRDNTAVAGSSLGGLVSLYIAAEHADRVGLCAALSPSLWWNDGEMLQRIGRDNAWTRQCRIWFDMGTAEESDPTSRRNVSDTRALSMILQGAGRKRGRDFFYLEVPGGEHNEAAWAARFDRVLVFLFGQ